MRREKRLVRTSGNGRQSGHQVPLTSLGGVALWLLVLCLQRNLATPGPDHLTAQQHASRGFALAQQGDLRGAEAELRRAVELAPDDPEFAAGLGSILGMQKRLEEAEPYFEKAVKLDPQNLVFRRNLAANQWQLGQLREAKGNLERILKAEPGDPPATLLLGMVMENLKDYTSAAQLLGSVLSLVQQRPESLAALTRAYYKTGQKEKARATLQTLQGHPAGSGAVYLGGEVAAEAEDYETAEKLLFSIRSTYPDTARLGYRIALVQFRGGRYREAQETLLDLTKVGHVPSDVYSLLGWCYEKQDQPKEAVRALQQAIALDPGNESNYLDLGRILANHRHFPAALGVAKENVARHPRSYRALVMKGSIELKVDQFTDAVVSYRQAAELDPTNPEAFRGLGGAQFAAGMVQEAKGTFEGALKQFPQDALLYQEYAKMLFKLADAGDPGTESRAVSLMNSALALDGRLSEPHYYLGNLALRDAKLREAVQHLETAARLDPKDSKTHYALARVYRRLGKSEDASKELRLHQELKAEEQKSVSAFSAGLMGNYPQSFQLQSH